MEKKESRFSFDEYASSEKLSEQDAQLVDQARKATQVSYAPYSNFLVGAAARLSNGEIVIGANQENASYPAGLCAERVLLASASVLYPAMPIDTIAISYNDKDGKSDSPISPCGICRQSLLEYEMRTKSPIRLILSGLEGKVFIIEKSSQLLPLPFGSNDL